jgi:hypothetical protein
MTPARHIRGHLELTVRGANGDIVSRRQATNIVLRNGAHLIARLFSGDPEVGGIDRVQVGFGREVSSAEVTELTPPAEDTPVAALRSTVATDSFEIEAAGESSVRVRVNAVFSPSVDLTDVTEAGLMAGDELYNQVVFEPVSLRVGQDVTFFWEVEFPFG